MAVKSKTIDVIIRLHDHREERKAVPADRIVWAGPVASVVDQSVARLIIGGVLAVTPVVTEPRALDGKHELVDFVIP